MIVNLSVYVFSIYLVFSIHQFSFIFSSFVSVFRSMLTVFPFSFSLFYVSFPFCQLSFNLFSTFSSILTFFYFFFYPDNLLLISCFYHFYFSFHSDCSFFSFFCLPTFSNYNSRSLVFIIRENCIKKTFFFYLQVLQSH